MKRIPIAIVSVGMALILFITAMPIMGQEGAGPSLQDLPSFQVHDNLAYQGERPLYVPGELIVKFKADVTTAQRSEALAKAGATLARDLLLPDYAVASFSPDEDVYQIAASLIQDRLIEEAEPNYYCYADFTPDDPYYPYQWHFPQIQMPSAWDISNGTDVVVAVVDTGVAYEDYSAYAQAPDLAGTAFVAGWDFVYNEGHPNDDNGHGTHVAGTIAQTTNNGLGVAGIAYGAKVMPVKVLDNTGSGTYEWVANGIEWAADHGARVINLSLGGPSPSSVLESAVNYAYERGVTVVAAAGNSGGPGLIYPAAYENAIAVGAVRYDETRSYYSSYGTGLDVVAPGGDIYADQNNDGYGDGVLQQTFDPNSYDYTHFAYVFYQGTSMAAPHVSGTAALLIAHGNATSPDEVRAAIESTAKDLGPAGWDAEHGYGLIQAHEALLFQEGTPTPTPTQPPSPLPTPTPTATQPPSPLPTPTP